MPTDTFTCTKYHCTLTRQACADRQAAVIERAGYQRLPTYPGCQECDQGKAEAQGMTAVKSAPRPWGKNNKFNNHTLQEGKMGQPSKIDNEKLKTMIAEGMFNDQIAERFGCVVTAVRRRIEMLGLTPNYRRNPKRNAAKPVVPAAAPAPVRQQRPLSLPSPTRGEGVGEGEDDVPAQIIPVTLRLTVEVNVRVSAQGCN